MDDCPAIGKYNPKSLKSLEFPNNFRAYGFGKERRPDLWNFHTNFGRDEGGAHSASALSSKRLSKNASADQLKLPSLQRNESQSSIQNSIEKPTKSYVNKLKGEINDNYYVAHE